MWFPIPDKPQQDKAGQAPPAFRQIGESGGRNVGINYPDLWFGAVLTDRGAGITKKTEIG